jgi:ABC-2 type transport system permease protein
VTASSHRHPSPGVGLVRRRSAVVTRLVARRAALPGALWGLVFGVVVGTSVSGYVGAYPTAAARAQIQASLASNAALQALFGPIHRLDTVAGFTAWRSLGVVSLLGAVWALLASTKFMRGEEEAGRWELLLAGPTTRGRAAADALAGLAAGAAAMFATTALVVVLVGQTSSADFGVGPSLFFALALVSSSALFLAVGALTSQLAPTRRRAAGLAAGVLGVSFVVRLVAAVGSGWGWLHWASPLGWIDELQPLTGARPVALVPIVVSIALMSWLTMRLAAARDLGASVVPDRDAANPHFGLLGGPTGLTVRMSRGVAIGWALSIAGMGVVIGLVARAAAKSLAESASIREALARLGATPNGALSYIGLSFVIFAMLVCLVAAGQVAATCAEELEGRVEHLLVRPVHRAHWLLGRIGVSIVVSALVAGASTWLGAALQHSGVGFGISIQAGCNVIAPAVFVLGIGTFVYGIAPRLAAGAAYGLVAWSFLIELVGTLVKASHWILDTSVLYHVTAAPAVAPNWTSALVLAGLGLVASAIGVLVFDRRDLVTA